MQKRIYITSAGKFYPGEPVSNEQMEDRLGRVGSSPSRLRERVLRQNQIRQRYYAIESAASLNAAQPWTGVAGWTNIQGAGQSVVYTNTASSQNLFFRARVWLGF